MFAHRFGCLLLGLPLLLLAGCAQAPRPEPMADLRPSDGPDPVIFEDFRGFDFMQTETCMKLMCDNPTPVCDESGGMAACRGCQFDGTRDKGECAGRMDGRIYCSMNNGVCTECIDKAQCASKGLTCKPGATPANNTCGPCTRHADCSSQLCDVYDESTGKGAGRCIPASQVVVVTTTAELNRAIADATVPYIRVLGGTYNGVVLDGKKLKLFGPDEGGPARLGFAAGDAVTVRGAAAEVLLDGFEISSTTARGISCEGGKLTLRRSLVRGCPRPAIQARDCTLTLDRDLLRQNQDTALRLEGKTQYEVTNTFIVDNTQSTAAVQIGLDSTGTFQFNTVANNMSGVAGGIDCGPSAQKIQDSIVYKNSSLMGSQLARNCTLERTVVGAADTFTGGTRMNPAFVDDSNANVANRNYRLSANMANDACCVNRAQANMKVKADHFGTRRPLGAGHDIGAHEAR